jgi:hypothetical protein
VYYLAVLKGRDRGFMRKQRCPAAPDFQPHPIVTVSITLADKQRYPYSFRVAPAPGQLLID